MRPVLEDVARRKFDVVVIGGGINGAGIAREAQLAGYRTLLVERDDFGSGTTSRATRLIHGGLRYLEHGELGLVHESLGEREVLLRTAAHLVHPLRLVVPVYAGDERPAWKVRAGLLMYDALSWRKSLPRSCRLARHDLDSYGPGLNRQGLRAAFLMSDAQVEFPERLVIEAVRDLTEAGGIALNHVEGVRLISPGGALRGVVLRGTLACPGGAGAPGAQVEFQVETAVVVNAAGPWADQLIAGSDAQRHDPLIGGTKGSHLVVDWPDGPTHAVFASAKADGRPFFILPWYRYTLVGTTDLRYDGDPSEARCTTDELRYLLDEATRLFPAMPLRAEHVLYTYSGVRPLPYTPNGDEAAITRAHFIIDHVKRGGPAGLLSVVGGKLTTYRSLSRAGLRAIRKHVSPSASAHAASAPAIPAPSLQPPASIPFPSLSMYGGRSSELRTVMDADPALGEPVCAHNPEVLAQVAYAVEREHAVTLADVLLRRLPCGWSACHGLDGADRAAGVMAKRLGWDGVHIAAEVAAYQRELRRTLVAVSDLSGPDREGGA